MAQAQGTKKEEGDTIKVSELDARVEQLRAILLDAAKLVEEKGALEIAEEIRTGAECITVNGAIWNLPTKEKGLADLVGRSRKIIRKRRNNDN